MRQTFILITAIVMCLCVTACKEAKTVGSIFTFDREDEFEDEDTLATFAGDTLHLFDEKDEDPPATVDELFNDFFYEFAGDMRFQKQRTRFPFNIIDGDEQQQLSRNEWASENRFAGQEFFSMIYDNAADAEMQKDTTISQVALDWIHLDDAQVETYRFSRIDGLWVLMDMRRKPIAEHDNASFLQFYSQFMTDSVYQHQSLATPLRLVLTPEFQDEETKVEELDAEQWNQLRDDLPFDSSQLINVDYGQETTGTDRKTLSIEGLSNGFVMKLHFTRSEEQWMLEEIEY